MSSQPHPETPERIFATELRQMFDRATAPASVGLPWVDAIRAIVQAAERMADAKDKEEALRRSVIDQYDQLFTTGR